MQFGPDPLFWLFGIVWFLFMLGLLALVVLAVVWLARRVMRESGAPGEGPRAAVRELELRYARGEIDRDTYLKIRDDLAGRG